MTLTISPPVADIDIGTTHITNSDWESNTPGAISTMANALAAQQALLDTVGTITKAISGDTNLSAPESANLNFIFTGSLSSSPQILLGAGFEGIAFIVNKTTGGFAINLAVNDGAGSPAGTSIAIVAGGNADIFSDGTDLSFRQFISAGSSGVSIGGALSISGALHLSGGAGIAGTITGTGPLDLELTDNTTSSIDVIIGELSATNTSGTRTYGSGVKGIATLNSPGGATTTLAANYGHAIGTAGSATRLEATAAAIDVSGGVYDNTSGLVTVTNITGGTVNVLASSLRSEGVVVSGGAVAQTAGLWLDSNVKSGGGTVSNNFGIFVDGQAGVGSVGDFMAYFNATAPWYVDAAGNQVMGAQFIITTTTNPAIVVQSSGAVDAKIEINNTTAAQRAGIDFYDAGNIKYGILKQTDNTFIIHDYVEGISAFVIDAGVVAIGESSTTGNRLQGSTWIVDGSLNVHVSIAIDEMVFSSRPGSPAIGTECNFSDSNTVVWGATVAGGGTSHVKARWNGADWTVVGI